MSDMNCPFAPNVLLTDLICCAITQLLVLFSGTAPLLIAFFNIFHAELSQLFESIKRQLMHTSLQGAAVADMGLCISVMPSLY
jgi:hypothetical protein